MINTIQTKQMQLTNGFYSIGSGARQILIMGSCRAVHYITYFVEWNKINGEQFTVNFIDPFNWNWDINDQRVDYLTALKNSKLKWIV